MYKSTETILTRVTTALYIVDDSTLPLKKEIVVRMSRKLTGKPYKNHTSQGMLFL